MASPAEIDKLLKEVQEIRVRAARATIETTLLQLELERSRKALRAAIEDSNLLREGQATRLQF